jgi:hypothetical protein
MKHPKLILLIQYFIYIKFSSNTLCSPTLCNWTGEDHESSEADFPFASASQGKRWEIAMKSPNRERG